MHYNQEVKAHVLANFPRRLELILHDWQCAKSHVCTLVKHAILHTHTQTLACACTHKTPPLTFSNRLLKALHAHTHTRTHTHTHTHTNTTTHISSPNFEGGRRNLLRTIGRLKKLTNAHLRSTLTKHAIMHTHTLSHTLARPCTHENTTTHISSPTFEGGRNLLGTTGRVRTKNMW